jgi:hypothetical protein
MECKMRCEGKTVDKRRVDPVEARHWIHERSLRSQDREISKLEYDPQEVGMKSGWVSWRKGVDGCGQRWKKWKLASSDFASRETVTPF